MAFFSVDAVFPCSQARNYFHSSSSLAEKHVKKEQGQKGGGGERENGGLNYVDSRSHGDSFTSICPLCFPEYKI